MQNPSVEAGARAVTLSRTFMKSLVALSVLSVWLVMGVLAQDGPRPSQLGSVTQQINQTKVTIDYSRPVARGRALFGELVPWGKIWTPGANDATTITVSTDLQ